MKVVIRQFDPQMDSGIIFSTWPNGLFYSSAKPIEAPRAHWFQEFYSYVKRSLATDEILIACSEEDPNTVLGYAVINGHTLEWVFVKPRYRRHGIATLLLKGQRIEAVNNVTKIVESLLPKLKGKNGTED